MISLRHIVILNAASSALGDLRMTAIKCRIIRHDKFKLTCFIESVNIVVERASSSYSTYTSCFEPILCISYTEATILYWFTCCLLIVPSLEGLIQLVDRLNVSVPVQGGTLSMETFTHHVTVITRNECIHFLFLQNTTTTQHDTTLGYKLPITNSSQESAHCVPRSSSLNYFHDICQWKSPLP